MQGAHPGPGARGSDPKAAQPEAQETARRVLDVIRDVTLELHPHKRRGSTVGLDSALDRDLGFDSLGRVELLARLGRAFRVRFPEALLADASTPRDLVAAILGGGVAEPLSLAAELRPLQLAPVGALPDMAATLVEMLEWHVDAHADRTHILLYGDADRGVEDTRAMLEVARAGGRIVSFPEGTFRRMPGVLPFKLGSFLAAAQAELPVVPVALRGTRSILRADQWLPRRGAVRVQIGKPVEPGGTDWSAAVHLRDRVRAEMLWLSGEPDLEEERVTF